MGAAVGELPLQVPLSGMPHRNRRNKVGNGKYQVANFAGKKELRGLRLRTSEFGPFGLLAVEHVQIASLGKTKKQGSEREEAKWLIPLQFLTLYLLLPYHFFDRAPGSAHRPSLFDCLPHRGSPETLPASIFRAQLLRA